RRDRRGPRPRRAAGRRAEPPPSRSRGGKGDAIARRQRRRGRHVRRVPPPAPERPDCRGDAPPPPPQQLRVGALSVRGDLLGARVMRRNFYLTTPIYYVNDVPHIGHAYTTVVADVIARFRRMTGQQVYFLTGTDEHGQHVERAAKAKGLLPLQFADEVVERFRSLWKTLGISNDDFIRTTEDRHRRGAERLYQKIAARGDIYKDAYKGWYCTSCESFYPESQIVDGRCPDQGHKVEWTEEESYFFRLSKYREPLLEHYREHPEFVFPETRRNEVVAFVEAGLKDLSISRSSFAWGIPLPDDPKHVLYVWFDALSNYITALGYGA